MRVLLVTHSYPPFGVAGVERVASQTAQLLAARGNQVTVLTRRPSAAPPTLAFERRVEAGVPVVTIAGGGDRMDAYPGHESALEAAFQRTLAEVDPEVVLISHLLRHSSAYVDLAHQWGIPVAMELHDFYAICPRVHLQRPSGELCAGPEGGAACAAHCFPDDPHGLARWSLRAHSFRRALQGADTVVCPSRFVADAFAPFRGDSPIEVLGNGVRPVTHPIGRDARPRDGRLHVASIGVTVEHKGLHVVVEALRRAALPAARYTILGVAVPPLDRELRASADAVRGLDLRLFGNFEPDQLPTLLGDVDVLVVPSLVAETYSIVTREALSSGIPVLASDIGALPEAIRPGENGWLFPPGDATALAVLLQRLDMDRDALAALTHGAASTSVTSVEQRVTRLEQILRETIDAGASAADADSALPTLRDAMAAELL